MLPVLILQIAFLFLQGAFALSDRPTLANYCMALNIGCLGFNLGVLHG